MQTSTKLLAEYDPRLIYTLSKSPHNFVSMCCPSQNIHLILCDPTLYLHRTHIKSQNIYRGTSLPSNTLIFIKSPSFYMGFFLRYSTHDFCVPNVTDFKHCQHY